MLENEYLSDRYLFSRRATEPGPQLTSMQRPHQYSPYINMTRDETSVFFFHRSKKIMQSCLLHPRPLVIFHMCKELFQDLLNFYERLHGSSFNHVRHPLMPLFPHHVAPSAASEGQAMPPIRHKRKRMPPPTQRSFFLLHTAAH